MARVFGFRVVRLARGIAIGTALGATFEGRLIRTVARYYEVFVPIRWLEWGVMEWLMRSRLWRLGGVGVSCLADLVLKP